MTLDDILRLAQSGARGFTTGLLGAPVDIANMAMGGVGGQKPVMGSEWIGDKLQNMGLLAAHANDLPNEITEFAGGLLNPGGGAAVGKGLLGGAKLAHIVFHGSPHTFDKFDMAKIGTGEGAQAYGHGLYFAENPEVAKSYQQHLSDWKVAVGGHDVPITPGSVQDRALAYLQEAWDKRDAGDPFKSAAKTLASQRKDMAANRADPTVIDDAVRQINAWRKAGATLSKPGNTYKVDIPDEAIGRMLDWDKPLSQQPQAVRELVAARPDVQKKLEFQQSFLGKEPSGLAIYTALAGGPQHSSAASASDVMRQAGIPGIKYLDQGSRSSGNGTSNYVLFDADLAKILERQ